MFFERETSKGKKGAQRPINSSRRDPDEELKQITTEIMSINELKLKIAKTQAQLKILAEIHEHLDEKLKRSSASNQIANLSQQSFSYGGNNDLIYEENISEFEPSDFLE